jgi:tRNA threonylcarbamoyladenosine biosynthesis protein TsaE
VERRIIAGIGELAEVVEYLRLLMPQCAVFTLTGSLGAGKTTLVRELLRVCGVTDVITSPTFTYVNVYKNGSGQTFYHFDCYRLKTLHDFMAAGFDEYLYAPCSWSFIEWPDIVLPLLTRHTCSITIEYCGPEQREFIINTSEGENSQALNDASGKK